MFVEPYAPVHLYSNVQPIPTGLMTYWTAEEGTTVNTAILKDREIWGDKMSEMSVITDSITNSKRR